MNTNKVVSVELGGKHVGDRATILLDDGRRIQRHLTRDYHRSVANVIARTPAQVAGVYLGFTG